MKSINLSGNFITQFEGFSNLASLEELDLNHNKITGVKDTRGLISMRRLNLANNFIESGIEKIKNLDRITNFWLENNPICRKSEFYKSLKKLMPKLTVYNGRKTVLPNELGGKFLHFLAIYKIRISDVVTNNIYR